MTKNTLGVIMHNVRSAHNVGALLRTCDGLGIHHVWLTGITPYPLQPNDTRLPHVRQAAQKKIHKTALGAEVSIDARHEPDLHALLEHLREDSWTVVGLEQDAQAIVLDDVLLTNKTVLVLGNEITGLTPDDKAMLDWYIEIPMRGTKESLNVTAAATIALYVLSRQ